MGFDVSVYRWLTDHPAFVDRFAPLADVLNRLGLGETLGFLCVMLILAGYLYGSGRWLKSAAAGLLSLILSGVVVQTLKHLFGRARPQMNLDGRFIGPNLIANGFDSFPSGHSIACFTLAAFFSYYFPRGRWFFYLAAFAVAAVGRVMFRHHFPTDVLAGGVLGVLLGQWTAKRSAAWVEAEKAPAPSGPDAPSDPWPAALHRGTAKNLFTIVLFSAAILFTGLTRSGLWDRDETEYAQAAIEMQQNRAWLVPTLEGQPFLEKPALLYWFVRPSYALFGVNEFSARLPSAAFGVATCAATYFLAESLWTGSGLYAGLILATSFLFVVADRLLMTDPILMFFTVLALLFYVRKRLALSYAAIGLAILAKGPFGFFPACIFLLFEGIRLGDFRRWLKESLLRHAAYALISAAIAAPWFLYTFDIQRGATENFFVMENIMRFLRGSEGHTGPLYYYVPVLLLGLLPWSFFFFPLVREEWKERAAGRWTMEPERLLLFLWIAAIFVFFSVCANKLPHYLLPAVPPAACLLGRFWRDRVHGPVLGSDRPFRWVIAVAILLTLAPAALYFVRPQYASLRLSAPFLFFVLFLMFARYLADRGDWQRSFGTVCLGTLLLFLNVSGVALPWVERFRVMKPIGLAIREDVPPGAKLVGYRVSEPSLFIYGGRRFPKLEQQPLSQILAGKEPVYVVTTKALLKAEAGKSPYRVLAEHSGFAENGGEMTVVLVTNAPS